MSDFEEVVDIKNLGGRLLRCAGLVNPKGKKILDIGSSFGWYEKYALQKDCSEIVGLEPNPKKIEQARRVVPGVAFVCAKADKLPFQNRAFDLVTMFDVLEHLPKNTENQTLKEIRRVLKPGGKIALSTPLSGPRSNFLDPAWYLGHRHYTQRGLEKLIKDANFKVELISFGGGLFEEISLLVFYFSKWILKKNPPNWRWLTERATKEWGEGFKGIMSVFMVAQRI